MGGRWIGAAVMAALLAVCGACGDDSSDEPGAQDLILDACLSGGLPEEQCECAADSLSETYSLDEFENMDSGQVSQLMLDALTDCQ